jgi:hypothetical protein
MSVMMIMHVPADPSKLAAYAAGPGGAVLEKVGQAGRAAGAVHHMFAAGKNEVVVVDEWPDEQTFRTFFDGQPEIADIMREAGATGEPTIEFYPRVDTPDAF